LSIRVRRPQLCYLLKVNKKRGGYGDPLLTSAQLSAALKRGKDVPKQVKPLLSAKQHKNLARLRDINSGKGIVSAKFDRMSGTPVFIQLKETKTNVTSSKILSKGLSVNAQPIKINQAAKAKRFLKDNADLLKIDNADNEFTLISQTSDNIETTHFKYQQTINGIPVWGKQVIVHLDSKDDIYLFNGRYNRSISGFDTVPTITAEQAVELAVNDLSSAAVTVRHDNIELVIYTQKDGRSVLTFQVTISSAIDYSWIYFINAKTGEVEHKYNDIQTAIVEASGTDLNGINRSFKAWHNPTDNLYYLIDPSTPTLAKNADPVIEGPQALGDTFVYDESTTPITIANNNTQDNWSDPIAVSAHYNTRLIYDYYKETYGRDSIDGKGQNLLIKISGKERLGNAFWHQGFIYYGEGNLFKSFAGCLIYANQSGALNESFADIMGAMIDKKDWTIGEDCAKSIPYLRSLKNPATELLPTHYRQPAHLKDYLNKENTKAGDYGGVHSNSGITNRAAYLISEGLTEEGLGQSIGRENTEQIYYRALTTYLTASATFVDARRGLIKSAEELFGSGSDDVTAIKIAFDAVGIVDTENFDSTPTPIETVDGDDIMAYLYTEEVNAENIDYQLFVQTFANPFTGYDPENDIGPYNDAAHGDLPAYYTKPAIVNVSSELKVFTLQMIIISMKQS
jgi:bacillolysin